MAISACDERMLRVVVFDSTHTQGSSKYFLITITKQDTGKELSIGKNPQMKTRAETKPADQLDANYETYLYMVERAKLRLKNLATCSSARHKMGIKATATKLIRRLRLVIRMYVI